MFETWNYMYSSMDTYNLSFSNFQHDSETLVSGVIEADHNGAGAGLFTLIQYRICFKCNRYIDTVILCIQNSKHFSASDIYRAFFDSNSSMELYV